MALNFPDSPTNGQSATLGGNTWTYNSTSDAWARAAAAGGSSITTYDSTTDLPLSGVSAGDQAFVTGSNRMYVSDGTGWYSVSLVNTNPSITSVQDSDGGSTPFTLATDGTGIVITITAADPEDVPLTSNGVPLDAPAVVLYKAASASTSPAPAIADFTAAYTVLTAVLNAVISEGIAVLVSAFLTTYQSVSDSNKLAFCFASSILFVFNSAKSLTALLV